MTNDLAHTIVSALVALPGAVLAIVTLAKGKSATKRPQLRKRAQPSRRRR